MAANSLRRYEALCAERCDFEPTFDVEVAEAWAALPLHARLRVILGPALRAALYEVLHPQGER